MAVAYCMPLGSYLDLAWRICEMDSKFRPHKNLSFQGNSNLGRRSFKIKRQDYDSFLLDALLIRSFKVLSITELQSIDNWWGIFPQTKTISLEWNIDSFVSQL